MLSLSNVHVYFRSVRGLQAALQCIRKAMLNLATVSKPRLVLVSDTPNFVKSIMPILSEFAEVTASLSDYISSNVVTSGQLLLAPFSEYMLNGIIDQS